jgi:glycine C-acetyltransferase
MEGSLCRLPEIVALAQRYEALVMVDDSHGTGVVGPTGRGTAEHFGLMDKVDIITGTLGKTLGGAAGGFVAARTPIIELLTQTSRPQLFSNALPPTVAASALAALNILAAEPRRVQRLHEKTQLFRTKLTKLGFTPLESESAIIPVIVGDTAFAIDMSNRLLARGVFVTGFGFPVVPEGTARVRCQISDALTYDDLDTALVAFADVGRELGLIGTAQ